MSTTRELASAFATAIEELRFIDAFNMIAEDGTYTIIGTTKASGTYHGRGEVLSKLGPLLSGFSAPPAQKFHNMVVEKDRAVLLGEAEGDGPTGRYHQPYYALSLRFANEAIAEIIEFLDTTMLDTAVFGKKIVDR